MLPKKLVGSYHNRHSNTSKQCATQCIELQLFVSNAVKTKSNFFLHSRAHGNRISLNEQVGRKLSCRNLVAGIQAPYSFLSPVLIILGARDMPVRKLPHHPHHPHHRLDTEKYLPLENKPVLVGVVVE